MHKLDPMVMIHFPKDWDEIMDWIQEHNKDEQAHLVVAAGMAWNLAWTMHHSEKVKDNERLEQ